MSTGPTNRFERVETAFDPGREAFDGVTDVPAGPAGQARPNRRAAIEGPDPRATRLRELTDGHPAGH